MNLIIYLFCVFTTLDVFKYYTKNNKNIRKVYVMSLNYHHLIQIRFKRCVNESRLVPWETIANK